MSTEPRPRVLCVDDEPAILEGLELSLRRSFEVVTATSGEQALRLLWQAPYPIVISDMRMPGMDGAALLAAVRAQFPDTVRLLLTGYADMEAAATAVNDGQIFRFLTKPCRPEVLQRALRDAAAQHRLLSAERELLERTLRGSVQTLTEVLALTDPAAYGRAGRIQKLALALAQRTRLDPLWPLELSAMLAPLGRVSLPPDLVQREERGAPLTTDDRAALARVPEVTERLLAPIPRLEGVREILRLVARGSGGDIAPSGEPELQLVLRSARVLRLASDFEELESRGESAAIALAELCNRKHQYEAELLAALQEIKGTEAAGVEIRSLPVRLLKEGMVLADDLLTIGGQRLVPRGFEVTTGFVERMRNLRPGALREPVRAILPRPKPQSAAGAN